MFFVRLLKSSASEKVVEEWGFWQQAETPTEKRAKRKKKGFSLYSISLSVSLDLALGPLKDGAIEREREREREDFSLFSERETIAFLSS